MTQSGTAGAVAGLFLLPFARRRWRQRWLKVGRRDSTAYVIAISWVQCGGECGCRLLAELVGIGRALTTDGQTDQSADLHVPQQQDDVILRLARHVNGIYLYSQAVNRTSAHWARMWNKTDAEKGTGNYVVLFAFQTWNETCKVSVAVVQPESGCRRDGLEGWVVSGVSRSSPLGKRSGEGLCLPLENYEFFV